MELHNLEVHPNGHTFTATDEGWMGQRLEVFAKWDGCMEISRRFAKVSGGEDDINTLHICDGTGWFRGDQNQLNGLIAFLAGKRKQRQMTLFECYPDENLWATEG